MLISTKKRDNPNIQKQQNTIRNKQRIRKRERNQKIVFDSNTTKQHSERKIEEDGERFRDRKAYLSFAGETSPTNRSQTK